MLKQIMNINGMTIVEVLVAAGLASIVSLGVATMMQNMFIEQKKVVLLSVLKEQKTRIEFLIRDQNSWNQTINCTSTTTPACATFNSTALFTSLRSSGATTKVNYASPEKIILMDATGAIAMNLLGPSDTAGNGFTEGGGSCTTFSTTAGTDACPISYRMLIGADCATGASCSNPQLKVVARLVFSPSATGTLNRFKTLVAQVSGSSIVDGPINDGSRYDVVVKRTSSQINRFFSISSYKQGATGSPTGAPANSDCTGYGAGVCTVGGAFANHPLLAGAYPNGGWTKDDDLNNLVTTSGANFSFTETGVYSCMISVPAYGTLGFSAELYKSGGIPASVTAASTIAGRWSQASAIIDTKFNVSSTADTYTIRQRCDTNTTSPAPASPQGDPNVSQCSLGLVPSSAYGTPIKIITMTCYKLDKSN